MLRPFYMPFLYGIYVPDSAAAVTTAAAAVVAATAAVAAAIAAATAANQDDQHDDPQTTAAIVITKHNLHLIISIDVLRHCSAPSSETFYDRCLSTVPGM